MNEAYYDFLFFLSNFKSCYLKFIDFIMHICNRQLGRFWRRFTKVKTYIVLVNSKRVIGLCKG